MSYSLNVECKMILMLMALVTSSLAQGPPNATVMDAKTLSQYHVDFQGFPYDMYFVGPSKYVLPQQYLKQGSIYYNYNARPDDVYLSYYPGAGTEWFSDVVWLLVNNLNFTAAQAKRMTDRVFWLEQSLVSKTEVTKLPVDLLPSPRILQTNLPFTLIPQISKSAKNILYFARNPKDTLIEFYNLFTTRAYYRFVGTKEKFWYYLQNDLVIFSPYWATVKEGYNQRTQKNVLFLYSEEDSLALTKKISTFLGKTYTDAQLKQVTDFMNQKAGIKKESWKNVFSPDLNGQMNKWIEKNIGELKFPNINIYS